MQPTPDSGVTVESTKMLTGVGKEPKDHKVTNSTSPYKTGRAPASGPYGGKAN